MKGQMQSSGVPSPFARPAPFSLTRAIVLAVASTLAISGCGGGGGDATTSTSTGTTTSSTSTTSTAPTASSVTMNKISVNMLTGGKFALAASAAMSDGSTTTSTASFQWTSSNPQVATVGNDGTVTGVTAGTSTVAATIGGVSGSATVTVNAMTNSVSLYLTVPGGGGTDYLTWCNCGSVTSSTTNLIRVVPDLKLGDLVTSNVDVSYARSEIWTYTVDDRLFSVIDSGSYPGSTEVLHEYDPRTNKALQSYSVSDDVQCCGALVGSTYYYITRITYDIFHGWVGGDLKDTNFAASSSSQIWGEYPILLHNGDPDLGGYAGMRSSNGALYDAKFWQPTAGGNYDVEIVKRDLTTGRPIASASKIWSYTGGANQRFFVAFDGDSDSALAVFQDKTSNVVTIWQLGFDGTAKQLYSSTIPDFKQLYFVDVAHGHLALGDGNIVFLYDIKSGAMSTFDPGTNYFSVRILYLTD
jgi:hypothetical protein